MKPWLTLALTASATLAGGTAFGWGSSGHRMIGEAAIEALPPSLPAFLRSEASAVAVGEYSREPDRSRGSGVVHDKDRDPGHFVDGGDDGKIAGVVAFNALPATREDYDTALRTAGVTSWKMGYLPYSIIADWQQLARDFAYWRVDTAGAAHTSNAAHRAWLKADGARREQQILIDIGLLSHFVGDGSMPLHTSIHYNGWGDFPNPNGYTQDHVHVPWEGVYVGHNVSLAAVKSRMGPFQDCNCPIEQRVGAYLMGDLQTVIPFYELQKAGAFQAGNPKGVDFTAARVAVGATELRDEIVLAWTVSEGELIGFQPIISVADVEAGKVDPYLSLYGDD